jgi:NitT/TauT family transport system permease protein
MSTIDRVTNSVDEINGKVSNGLSRTPLSRGHISAIIAILVWEFGPLTGIVPKLLVPPFHEVLITFYETTIASQELTSQIMVSARRAIIGFTLGISIAIPLGVLIGWRQALYDYTVVIMDTLRTLPAVALIPIFLLIFGPSETTILAVIFYPVFFYQLVATVYGTQDINQTLIESMEVLQMGEWKMFKNVFLPGSLPGIFTGLRQNTATMLVLTIVAEMLLSSQGLGRYIMDTQREFQIPRTYAGILSILILGYIFNKIVVLAQKRWLDWSEGQTM